MQKLRERLVVMMDVLTTHVKVEYVSGMEQHIRSVVMKDVLNKHGKVEYVSGMEQ